VVKVAKQKVHLAVVKGMKATIVIFGKEKTKRIGTVYI